MRHDVIDTLSRELWEAGKATAAVRASGFRPGLIPSFQHGAMVFWSEVVTQVENGAPPGLQRVLEAAYEATASTAIWALLQGADDRVDKIAHTMARLFCEALAAKQLVQRAGFPRMEVPEFSTPATFWTTVVTATCSGAASIDALLHEARRLMPYNADLAQHQESVRRSPIRTAALAPRLTVDAAIARLANRRGKDDATELLCEAIAEARAALSAGDVARARRALGG